MVQDRWDAVGSVLTAALLLAACSGGEQARDPGETDSTLGSSTGPSEPEPDATTGTTTQPDDSSSTGTAAGQSSSGSTTGGEPLPLCDARPQAPTGLSFDGEDDHVTMGIAPGLGLETFTLEAWVRRDDSGLDASTGSGGLSLVPIIAKGRGETDDTIYNCNYAFGFRGNVLGADFEDAEDGGNHPVVGTTAVSWGQWHHVAATYDGSDWRLFLDGQLEAQATADGATPRADSVQHFSLGTTMDSAGVPGGALAGALDEVRVWDRARTQEEIESSMFETVAAGDGLVSRWALEQADASAPDSLGLHDGTIAGATFTRGGAVLDRGVPPTISATAPSENAVVPAAEAVIGLAIDDPEQSEFVATFYVRELSVEDDFTVVVLPDTQYYSDEDSPNGGSPQYFYDQTQWVRDNREAYNILAVIHNGDLVNNGDRDEEWVIADAAMARLETPEPDLPDGVPYGVCVGNHDQDVIGQDGSVVGFNTWFGVDRFAARGYYGGHYGAGNEENWITFAAGGLEFVVVNLQYDTTPDPGVLVWARTVFEAHPDAFGILNTHYVLGASGNFSPQAQAIYTELRATSNVHLMTGGHVSAESRRTDVFGGHAIHSMLADYQFDGDGGTGFMRIWEFSPANGEVTIRTYSPSIDTWLTDDDSEFTLQLDLPGAGGSFAVAGAVDPAPSDVTVALEGLAPDRTYEWYATVSDCSHTAQSPIRRFTTLP